MVFGTEITNARTIQAKREEIPNKIKQLRNRDKETKKNINLNSFIVNSKTTGKRISIVSTMHPIF